MQQILAFIASIFGSLRPKPVPVPPPAPTVPTTPPPVIVTPPVETARERLFDVALSFIGKDASPDDAAPDEYGCADTVCSILEAAFPGDVGFPHLVSTTQLYRSLQGSDKYALVLSSLEGDIVISPTGYGNGSLANGHVGIRGSDDVIMSNSSATGTFEPNYSMEGWRNRYVTKGGFPMVFFRRK